MVDSFDALIGPVIIVAADVVVFYLIGRLGKRTTGTGVRYQPFTGGEESVPARGLYQSSLFVFSALFLAVEAFTLLLAGSFAAASNYYPLLFLSGGGSVIVLTVVWFIYAGGGEF